ncbi:hypothetical protein [Dechloromonas sp. CZR5]|uniref:hypothetical protein n=1 Tax=Dechloromonas sp. CZR5 TaxID=2608630 RepID=UPI00123DAABC|nr:hypothetical protein [Dechloromonas sp. CZR5]
MLIYLQRLRDHGRAIPKWQFATLRPIPGDLMLREERDDVLNRHTRVARLRAPGGAAALDIPRLLDAQLIELSDCRLILSGIERIEEPLVNRVEDFAQTWVCWLKDD